MRNSLVKFRIGISLSLVFILGLNMISCRSAPSERTLTLAAYTAPREAFREINQAFEEAWFEKTKEKIQVKSSYLSSGAQSRAVRDGFAADVVALALASDINRLVKAGLITHPWQQGPTGGILNESVVALAVRPGNPKKIRDWKDLLQPGLAVLTPNPKTSGGAQWNVLAVYGAALAGQVPGFAADERGAQQFLVQLLGQITAMDKGARESILTFERGLGDVALSYENEILTGQHQGQDYELIVPPTTILIENPVALVDQNIALHQNRDLAEAYLAYLYSPKAQDIFTRHGFRPVKQTSSQQNPAGFAKVPGVFNIQSLGGWSDVHPKFFGPEGIFVKAMQQLQRN